MTYNITIIGAGALGSHAAMLLRNVVDTALTVVDFDRVEAKNVLSQFHAKTGMGKNKTEALKQLLSFLWSTKMTAVPHRLTETNIATVIGKVRPALVIDAVDNGATRRLIQDFCRLHQIPCLHGALAANGAFGRVVWSEHFTIDDEAGAGAATCEDGAHLPFIALVSAYLAHSAQLFLTQGLRRGFSISPAGAVAL